MGEPVLRRGVGHHRRAVQEKTPAFPLDVPHTVMIEAVAYFEPLESLPCHATTHSASWICFFSLGGYHLQDLPGGRIALGCAGKTLRASPRDLDTCSPCANSALPILPSGHAYRSGSAQGRLIAPRSNPPALQAEVVVVSAVVLGPSKMSRDESRYAARRDA